MSRALIYSIALITAVYLLVNVVFLKGLGLSGLAGSQAVAADLMRRVAGPLGAAFISVLIVIASFSTVNAMIITGARTGYALGRDFSAFRFLARWQKGAETPVNAMIVQGVIALLLVFLGTGTRSGFEMMVEYTAPVFWIFFLLVGISVIVLRIKEPLSDRPFRVPLYPWIPILFCGVCLYMLQSSLVYTGKGALLGLSVLAAGLPLLFLRGSPSRRAGEKESVTRTKPLHRKENNP